ncbi:hypothetical protein UlMin_001785 [Ulmus minor]
MGVDFTVSVFGVLILAHAAYSTVQYRGLLKITEEEFSGLPMDVMVELILGSIFCMWAARTVPGKFLLIHPNLGNFLSFLRPICPLLLDSSRGVLPPPLVLPHVPDQSSAPTS